MNFLHDIHSFNLWIGDSLDNKKELKEEKQKPATKSSKAGGKSPDEDKSPEAGENSNS
jgi:hypothetical protein